MDGGIVTTTIEDFNNKTVSVPNLQCRPRKLPVDRDYVVGTAQPIHCSFFYLFHHPKKKQEWENSYITYIYIHIINEVVKSVKEEEDIPQICGDESLQLKQKQLQQGREELPCIFCKPSSLVFFEILFFLLLSASVSLTMWPIIYTVSSGREA